MGADANSDRSAHWARGLDFKLRCPVQEVPLFREADLSVSSSLSRDRVMEARFDIWIIQLSNRARAIGGVMFCREAWDALSELDSGPCCSRYHIAKGPVGGALRLELGPSHRPSRAGT